MQKAFRLLCVLSIFLSLINSGVKANTPKKNNKSTKTTKQKKDAKAEAKSKTSADKKAVAAGKSKADAKGAKNDKRKAVAETKRGGGSKTTSTRQRKEEVAKDKKKNSRAEPKTVARQEKAGREKSAGKNQRQTSARQRSTDDRASKASEVEQTRPRTVTRNKQAEVAPVPATAERAAIIKPAAPEPQPKMNHAAPLPAAQNPAIEVIEDRVSSNEERLLPPPAKSRDVASGATSERHSETPSAPVPSAKNEALSVPLPKAANVKPDLLQSSNETMRMPLPQPQVSVVKPPLVTSSGSTSKIPEVRTPPQPLRSDEAKLIPNTGNLQQSKPEQTTAPAADDTQQNSSPLNSRSGIALDRVVEIQRALIKKGYLEGEATGVYDDTTKQAMKRFQLANNLSATGLPSAHALKKLGVSKRPDNSYAVTVKSSSSADRKP